jgi:hypothetical protein
MKAKAIIAAILAVHNNAELDHNQHCDQYVEIVAGLVNKCDELLKNRDGHYPWHTGFAVNGVSFRADRFKMADEPWRAVMHGLQMAGFDPASMGLYPGGFLLSYIQHRLETYSNHMSARNVETFEYARQMTGVVREIETMMIDHGWGDTLTADPLIRYELATVRNDVNDRLSRGVLEVVELAEEVLELRKKGENITGKQHDRMTGVERYVRNNRSKVETALSLMSYDSPLKQQETRILRLLHEIATDAHIPRPEKKAYEPKPASPKSHKKGYGNGKGRQHGGNKPKRESAHDFVSVQQTTPVGFKQTGPFADNSVICSVESEPVRADDDETVPTTVDHRGRTPAEILSAQQ